jgi:methyl-coenzyme M reductase subunit D
VEEIRPEIQIFPYRLMSEERAQKLVEVLYGVEGVSNISFNGPGNMVGWLWVELLEMNGDGVETVSEICEVCTRYLPFGYEIQVGRFTKYRPTIADYLKRSCLIKKED